MVWAAKTMHISCWTALTYANLILITQAQAAFFIKKKAKGADSLYWYSFSDLHSWIKTNNQSITAHIS